MNGLLRRFVKGMAYIAGDHHLDNRPGKARLAGGSVRGEDQNAV